MKAITIDELGTQPALGAGRPAPTPGTGEVLVRLRASSVNPVDNAIAAGMLKGMVEHEFPITLGRDYAGVVEQVGADVTGFSVGDEVFGFIPGMSPIVHAGSWAELIVVPESMSVARKPDGVDLATAGAAPLAAITAMTAIDALALADGDTLLVVGATGGVGSLGVQLAVAAGATVIAPASPTTSATSAGSASPTSCRAATTSRPRSGSATPTASTPCSTPSPSRRAPTTPRSRTVPASPRRTARRARVLAAPT